MQKCPRSFPGRENKPGRCERANRVRERQAFEMQELERLELDQLRRQELYKEFIEQASKLYIHALQNDKADVFGVMGLYAEVSRMRALSSAPVVDSADQIVKGIIKTYLEPNKSFPELQQMASTGLIDPLRNFSEACRTEAEGLDFGPPG